MPEVRCPISVLGAEIDKISPPELVKQFEKVLLANSAVSSHFKNLISMQDHLLMSQNEPNLNYSSSVVCHLYGLESVSYSWFLAVITFS